VEDDPTCDDGDFKKIDKTIKAILMSLHINSGVVYLDLERMTPENVRLYKCALKVLGHIRVVKVTRLDGNRWVVVSGSMPSGVFDTSDGDSWIVYLLVCLWIEHIRTIDPDRTRILDRLLPSQFRPAIYGDDHLFSIGRKLRQYMDEWGFANYVEEYWDMKIRSIRVGLPLLTTVKRDAAISEGALFLKRNLILRPKHLPDICAKVVAWKPAWYHFVRIPYSSSGQISNSRIICSIIGHAWDSMGTNLTAYRELSFIYNEVMGRLQLTEDSLRAMIQEEYRNERVKTKLLKKLGIPLECFYKFPTMAELIAYQVPTERCNFEKDYTLAFGEEASRYDDLVGLYDY